MTYRFLSNVALRALLFGVCTLLSVSKASAASVGLVPDEGCLTYLGTIFCDDSLRSTGTGTFDPFLRNNTGGGPNSTTSWNTDSNTFTQFNQADASQTKALKLSDIGTSDGGIGGPET